ncbi:phage baseplate assembly protein [Methylobacterium sp. 391_Methyba4]|uniref:phage baseplate assembly protein domain-containing protein n=1 Tax=Methylobacterium sp. 391_Methyba4 TaxID=3038924 RepID=UPI00241DDADD|nr:phage baseplate assembly protein [Methylobacterium sp. 391_Methyba4]WFS07787.1 phage baseplate assembly protein [Methylobacterium sp. 391_Methyba4]
MGGRLFRVEHVEADDEGDQQTLTLYGLPNETLKKVPRVQHFGLSSNPPVGSHGMGLQFGGQDGSRLLNAALGLEHAASRPRKQKPGQTTLYDDKGNATRYLGDDGIWHDAKDRPQKLTGKTIEITGTDKVVVKVDNMTVTVTANRVDLGGEGGSPVMTQAGPSSVVFAKT